MRTCSVSRKGPFFFSLSYLTVSTNLEVVDNTVVLALPLSVVDRRLKRFGALVQERKLSNGCVEK